MKKFLSLFLAFVMILSLSACGKDNDPDSSSHNRETRPTVDTTGAVGSVTVAGPSLHVTVYYDENGKVVAIGDATAAPAHTGLTGQDCVAAISQILKENDPPMAINSLLVKQTVGSQTPSDNFLETIVTEAKAALGDNVTVIPCPMEEQTETGCISPEIANALLAAYLGNLESATYSTITDFNDDGCYEISITIDDRTDTFLVNAYNGRIELIAGSAEPEPEEEEIYDYYIDYSSDINFNAYFDQETPEQ